MATTWVLVIVALGTGGANNLGIDVNTDLKFTSESACQAVVTQLQPLIQQSNIDCVKADDLILK